MLSLPRAPKFDDGACTSNFDIEGTATAVAELLRAVKPSSYFTLPNVGYNVPYTSTLACASARPGAANAPATAIVRSFFCMLAPLWFKPERSKHAEETSNDGSRRCVGRARPGARASERGSVRNVVSDVRQGEVRRWLHGAQQFGRVKYDDGFTARSNSATAVAVPSISKFDVQAPSSNFGARGRESIGGRLTGWFQVEQNAPLEREATQAVTVASRNSAAD